MFPQVLNPKKKGKKKKKYLNSGTVSHNYVVIHKTCLMWTFMLMETILSNFFSQILHQFIYNVNVFLHQKEEMEKKNFCKFCGEKIPN